MRSFCFVIGMFLLIGNGFAQKNNVQTASNLVRDEIKKNPNKWVEAKKYIDLAAAHPSTSNWPKMWNVRCKTYYGIYGSKKDKHIDTNAIEKVLESAMACIKSDARKDFNADSKFYLANGAIGMDNVASNAYNNKNYRYAISIWLKILDALPFDEDKTLARNNVTESSIYKNCALAAKSNKDYPNAMKYTQILIDQNYQDPEIYANMSDMYMEVGDTTKALEVLAKGREIFEESKLLLNRELVLYTETGKIVELKVKLDEAIRLDEYNAQLYLVRGNVKMKYDTAAALEDYKKAVEMDGGNFDANYNAGSIIYNDALEDYVKADALTSNSAYEVAMKAVKKKFNAAIPYFETCHEINPEDKQVLQVLIELYGKTGNTEKFTLMKKRIDELKAN